MGKTITLHNKGFVVTEQEKKDARNKRERNNRAKKKEEAMSKTEKKEEEKKLLPVERYYAYSASYTMCYNAVNPKTGEPLPKRDNKNLERYNGAGDPIIIQKHKRFSVISAMMSVGFLSYCDFDPNTTDKQKLEMGRCLRELSNRPDIVLWDEETHEKTSNFAAYQEKQKVKNLEDSNAELTNTVATLQARIAEAEGK